MSISDGLDRRRRRAIYRASHRGTREMDWLLGRFAEARVPGMTTLELDGFERLLQMQDPDIESWIMGTGSADGEPFGDLIAALRRFHGLTS